MQVLPKILLALDVGERRIGVARARSDVRLASPLKTIPNDDVVWRSLQRLLKEQEADAVVIGLPRGLEGQRTTQTRTIEAFAEELKRHVNVKVFFQDEALTSVQAESELNGRGEAYAKEEVDALAATYILEDFLQGSEIDYV